MIFYLILLITSLSATADCFIKNVSKTILKDSAKVSLFEPGKSLSSHKIQDQDGLGTCYANAASVVLKSVLPKNPDVSYLHMAMEATTNDESRKWSKGAKYVVNDNDEDLDNVVSYGNICESIEATKRTGGACPSEHSILEHKKDLNPFIQNDLMINVGKYFDKLNEARSDPKKYNEIKNDLSLAVAHVTTMKEQLLEACFTIQPDIPLKRSLTKILEIELLKLDEASYCESRRKENIKEIIGKNSLISKDRVKVDLTKELLNKLQIMINTDPDLKTAKYNLANADLWGSKIAGFISHVISGKTPKECTKNPFKLHQKEMGEIFIGQMNKQIKTPCEDYVRNADAVDVLNSCLPDSTHEQVINALQPLMSIGALTDPSVLNKLTDPNVAFALQLKKIILPGCLSQKNLISLKHISCSSFSMCDIGNRLDFDNTKYHGPKKGCYSDLAAKELMRSKVISDIDANKALGVKVCTGFMIDPEVRTGFCKKPAKGIKGHGIHAMTISGYRCEKGQIQYEIVNSWGKEDCPAKKQGGLKNSAIECVLDEQGNPTGKFWVKEEVLVDNTISLIDINSKGGK